MCRKFKFLLCRSFDLSASIIIVISLIYSRCHKFQVERTDHINCYKSRSYSMKYLSELLEQLLDKGIEFKTLFFRRKEVQKNQLQVYNLF